MNNIEVFIKKTKGSGNLNFILIPNAGGDHHFFKYQINMLKKFGDIIQLDLPGHGKSPIAENPNINSTSRLILDICEKKSLENICLIGLNNGASIAINTLSLGKNKIKSLILIDPPVFLDKDFIKEIRVFINKLDLESANYKYFIDELVNNILANSNNENKIIAKNSFLSADKESLKIMFSSLLEWDKKDAKKQIKNINCPTLCILTDEHHCSYQRIKQENSNLEIGKVIGSKCWATLEAPDQVNSMIERFLELHSI